MSCGWCCPDSLALQAAGFGVEETRAALRSCNGDPAAALARLCGALRSAPVDGHVEKGRAAEAEEQRSEELMALAAIYDGAWPATARRVELPAHLPDVAATAALVVDLTNSPLYPMEPPGALIFRPAADADPLPLVVVAAIQRGLMLEAVRLCGEPSLHGAHGP